MALQTRVLLLSTVAVVLVAVAAGLLIHDGSAPNQSGQADPPDRADPAAATSTVDPTSLESLEKALVEAGQITDPELRERRTREIGDALISFHIADEVAARDEPADHSDSDSEETADADHQERNFDLASLRAEFEEALQTRDTHLRRLALGAVAEFLAARDPALASAWMRELLASSHQSNGRDAYYFASMFTQAYAPLGLTESARWAEILPPETLRPVAYQHIAREWAARDLAAVERWVRTIDDPRLRTNAIRAVDNVMSGNEAEIASAWARRLAADGRDGPRLSDVVVRHWGRTDIDGAISWTNSLERDDDVARAVSAIASAFAAKEPQEAAEWAAEFPAGEARDQALMISTNHWGTKDAPAAVRWLKGLDDPSLLEASFPSLAASWYDQNPAAALAWIDSAPVSEQLRGYVRNLVAGTPLPVAAPSEASSP
jgi:hypothetical protein